MYHVFNPHLYAMALIAQNHDKIYKTAPAIYDIENKIGLYTTDKCAYITAGDLFNTNKTPESIGMELKRIKALESDYFNNKTQADHESIFDNIKAEYGLYTAWEYKLICGRDCYPNHKLDLMFYEIKKRKPINNSFRDKCGLHTGFKITEPSPYDNGLTDGRELLTINGYYSGSGTTAYCAVWYRKHDPNGGQILSGYGKASGYGYDRLHDALDHALQCIGFQYISDGGGSFESLATMFASYLSTLYLYRNKPLYFIKYNG